MKIQIEGVRFLQHFNSQTNNLMHKPMLQLPSPKKKSPRKSLNFLPGRVAVTQAYTIKLLTIVLNTLIDDSFFL